MKKNYTRKQIQETIAHWKKQLNESMTANSIASDIENALNTIVDAYGNKSSGTTVHVGPKGFYIGDVCDVKEDNGIVVLEIKQKTNNGPVEGGLTATDVIEKLNAFGNEPAVMRIPYDAISRRLRRKDYEELEIGYVDS